MRLSAPYWRHGKTSSNRYGIRDASTEGGGAGHYPSGTAGGASGAVAGDLGRHPAGDGGFIRGGPCHGRPFAGRLSAIAEACCRQRPAPSLRRSTQCSADGGARGRFFGSLAGAGPGWQHSGRLAFAGSVGATVRPTDEGLGCSSIAGPTRLAEGGAGHASSQERSANSSGLEKKLP